MTAYKFKRRLRLAGIPIDDLLLPVSSRRSRHWCVKVLCALLALLTVLAYVNSAFSDSKRAWVATTKGGALASTSQSHSQVGETKNSSVVYLADSARLEELRRSLKYLFNSFISKYNHQVIVFFSGTDSNNADFYRLALLSELRLCEEEAALITFEPVHFHYPDGFSEADLDQVVVWSPAFPAYNHAVAFWAYHVFQHPRIRNLEYFWRLDVDAEVFQPIKVDLFDLMREKGYYYGYRHQGWHQAWSVQGVASLVHDFARTHHVEPAQPANLREYLSGAGAGAGAGLSTFYSSFEIVHVPTFLRDEFEAFRLAFYNTKRIYTHRWSEAPQRYALVNLFLQQKQVHQVCESAFEHMNIRLHATC